MKAKNPNPTIRETHIEAMRQLAADAAERMQPGPDRPVKLSFPFNLQTRKPTDGSGIVGAVNTKKP